MRTAQVANALTVGAVAWVFVWEHYWFPHGRLAVLGGGVLVAFIVAALARRLNEGERDVWERVLLRTWVLAATVMALFPNLFVSREASLYQTVYRGVPRWNGWFLDPNTVGVVLGLAVMAALHEYRATGARLRCGHVPDPETSTLVRPPFGSGPARWLSRVRLGLRLGLRLREGTRERDEAELLTATWLRPLFLCALILCAFQLCRTYSRVGFLVLLVGFLPILKLQWTGASVRHRRIALGMVLAALVALPTALSFARSSDHLVLRRIGSFSNSLDLSWGNRITAMAGAIEAVRDRPLAGWGWERFPAVHQAAYKPEFVRDNGALLTNDFACVAGAFGIPAWVALLIALGWALAVPASSALQSMVGGLIVAMFFQGVIRNPAPCLMLALCIGLLHGAHPIWDTTQWRRVRLDPLLLFMAGGFLVAWCVVPCLLGAQDQIFDTALTLRILYGVALAAMFVLAFRILARPWWGVALVATVVVLPLRSQALSPAREDAAVAAWARQMQARRIPDAVFEAFVQNPGLSESHVLTHRRELWLTFFQQANHLETGRAVTAVWRTVRSRFQVVPTTPRMRSFTRIWRARAASAAEIWLCNAAALKAVGIPARLDGQRLSVWSEGAWHDVQEYGVHPLVTPNSIHNPDS